MKSTSKTSKSREGMQRRKLQKRSKQNAAQVGPLHCQECGALCETAIDQYRSADGRKVLCMQHFLKQFSRDFAAELRGKLEAQLEAYETAEAELHSTLNAYTQASAVCAENETLLKQLQEQSRTDASKLDDAHDMQLQVQRDRWNVSEAKTKVTIAKSSMTRATNKARDYADKALLQRKEEEEKLKKYRASVHSYKIL